MALGDSFASGESNPDRPVQFSAAREMVYDPIAAAHERCSGQGRDAGYGITRGYGLASNDDQINPKVLPRRLMEDEAAERFHKLASPEFLAAFDKASARWLSHDCHRSQYGYPFRVAIQLALENRHRSVTLASFTCSGAEVAEGLFLGHGPARGRKREPSGKVRAQLDQLSDLLCRGARARRGELYAAGLWPWQHRDRRAERSPRAGARRNRASAPIDVVLMSIGGNDVGFGGLAAYAMTESLGDLAPIAA